MHLARVLSQGPDGKVPRIVACLNPQDGWVDVRTAEQLRLEDAGATSTAALRLASALVPESMSAALAGGETFMLAARRAANSLVVQRLSGQLHFTNALDPSGYRDFMAFEKHFRFGYEWQGKPVPDVLYEFPVSYFGNPLSFIGPGDEIPWPQYSQRMDYELELGIVIGKAGTNISPENATAHVAGYTILNDFSARDIQGLEMTAALGPSKGKHFACGAGPYITTVDAFPTKGARMQARVNGETWCDSNSAEMIWTVAEIVAWASQAEQLVPGMLLGSGTCNGGSSIELGRTIRPNDVIELEIEGLGILSNRFGAPAQGGWRPSPRVRSE